ncbi:Mur ligase, partial [Gorgonomyces haynaldii]
MIIPGLERTQKLLKALGNPEQKTKIVHVAGTNGKGSVCCLLQSVLSLKHKTGWFYSPHLIHERDSVRINGKPLSETQFTHFYSIVKSRDSQIESGCTLFELLACTAFVIFCEERVDVAVIETGMGGLLDATNVVDPILCIITKIGLDHTEFLGSDIKSIANHKAGIIKHQSKVVLGKQEFDEAVQVVEEQCVKQQAQLFKTTDYPVFESQIVNCPLNGDYQRENLASALLGLECLKTRGFDIQLQEIVAGLQNVHWPGRLEWIKYKGKQILLDGSHNTQGAQKLKEYVATIRKGRVRWIFGCSNSKDPKELLKLVQEGDLVYPVVFGPVQGMPWISAKPVKELYALIQDPIIKPGFLESLDDCCLYDDQIIIYGSLYLVGHVYQIL